MDKASSSPAAMARTYAESESAPISSSLVHYKHETPDSTAGSTLLACYAGLPGLEDMVELEASAKRAEKRGYFNPVEDEALRETYARYLGIRVTLWQLIQSLKPQAARCQSKNAQPTAQDLRGFAIAFCAAELIVRTGEYLIDLARARDLVWQKLDEAEPRYGVPRKSFTRLYRQLTSAFRMHGFYHACETYDRRQKEIVSALGETARGQEIADILETLNLPTASRGDHLTRYRGFLRHTLRRRQLSAFRNVVFTIFEMMGSDIADLKIPLVKPPRAPKRVTADTLAELRPILQPGDVLVTRHDDAMSNLFLPGFWPHSALWLGAKDADILEAKKDGVLLRKIEETLQVDAFVVLRPRLDISQIENALTRARSHCGKLYDFIFDFRTSDRLVCTELIYRTFHGIGPIDFELGLQAGRHCLSAEDLINQGVGRDGFDVVALYGLTGERMLRGEAAKEGLRQSFAATF